jgi:DNA polymerase-3 subunit delta'
MPLKDIFCQDKTIAILQRAFASDKVPHAYIFSGLEGVGKFKTAREWAKLLLCNSAIATNGFADSCGSCQSCRLFEADSHPDFSHIYKELIQFTEEGKGRKTPVDLPIDVVREFLIEKVATRPTVSQRKVFVVSEAEKLNTASQNCLLKVLEEPPKYCCIILLCTRLERLLPTTKSRCQTIRFNPIDEDKIIEKLKEMGLEEKQAQYFARLSQGSLGQACQWAQLAGVNLYQIKKKLVTSLVRCELAGALETAGDFLDESKKIAAAWGDLDKTTSKTDINRRAQKTLVQIIISVLYDVMKRNVTPAPLEIPEYPRPLPAESESKKGKFLTGQDKDFINFDQKAEIQKLAGRLTPEQAAEKIADCYMTLRWIDSAVNERFIFEQLLLNLSDSDIMKV